MIDLLGIVNFEDDRVVVEGLSQFRTIPALSFLGRYRVIDFILSNMVNSSMDQIKILVKDKPRSLIEHIGNGSQYDINSKHGSLQILYTDQKIANNLYYTDIALLKQYATTIEESRCDYVVVAPSYMICTINYQDVVKKHIESKADISCVYKAVDDANVHFKGCTELFIDDNRVTAFKRAHGSVSNKNIFMETYVMSKKVLLDVIEKASSLSALYTLSEYIEFALADYVVRPYQYEGYLACINSLQEYFDVNMSLIDHNEAVKLFKRDWPIYTKTNDSPPAFYTHSARVTNCIVANGCSVHGTLDRCILGRGVIINKGAVIKNSIILPKAEIGSDANIEYTIVDKHAKVIKVKEIKGNNNEIVYIKRRDIV